MFSTPWRRRRKDDKPLSEEDRKAVAEAEKAIVQGKAKPWGRVKREMGL